MIRIDCNGGQIGRFSWENSGRGGLFLQCGEFFTTFRPGRCWWNETWPEYHNWPVSPWGVGDAADDHWRDFAAFEPWFHRQLEDRNLDEHDLTITDKIELYSLLCDVFKAGIDAGRDPWSWAQMSSNRKPNPFRRSNEHRHESS